MTKPIPWDAMCWPDRAHVDPEADGLTPRRAESDWRGNDDVALGIAGLNPLALTSSNLSRAAMPISHPCSAHGWIAPAGHCQMVG